MLYTRTFLALIFFSKVAIAQPWKADLNNGNYKNPILFADYSDPDIIRVGKDFYMVASSFNCMPGIPILHSNDLVNWKIINHVYDSLPFEKFNKPAHGFGSWAPSIRFHNGLFYVYFCTPYLGLFVATTKDPKNDWKLEHIVEVELWEDPCPFWDDDGQAYLVRSKLRADVLYLHKMSKDGKKILDNGTIIYNNLEKQPVIEGPKIFKKDGYYYILAPAGGVPVGWQTALRSKNIYGPYEDRIVLQRGTTDINGPHQGGLVDLPSGEWWFAHFQDRGAYGRVVHLQPVRWEDGWPLMGKDLDNDGIGEPVLTWKKPSVGKTYPIEIPQTSDEFNSPVLGMQWQWQANPQKDWYSLTSNEGYLRLNSVRNFTQNGNFWFVSNLLLQKFSSPSFRATTNIKANLQLENEKAGLVIMGEEWAYVALTKTEEGNALVMCTGSYFQGFDKTEEIDRITISQNDLFLKVEVADSAICTFYYSLDGNEYKSIGSKFEAKKGRWIGAKVGLFALHPNIGESKGYADFDWFRME